MHLNRIITYTDVMSYDQLKTLGYGNAFSKCNNLKEVNEFLSHNNFGKVNVFILLNNLWICNEL